jgi:hypothetical protein
LLEEFLSEETIRIRNQQLVTARVAWHPGCQIIFFSIPQKQMESISVWKCDCGIEWRALEIPQPRLTEYTCVCGHRRSIRGKVIHLYYAPGGQGSRAHDWKEVTVEKFEIRE